MGSVIGEILPLAVGIAISPIPIIAAILMLLSPRAKATSVGFLLGWLAGILVAVVLFTLLSSVLPQQDSSGSSPVSGVIKIILGPCCFSWQQSSGEPGRLRANKPPCRSGCPPSTP
jgi:Na+/proline symporter